MKIACNITAFENLMFQTGYSAVELLSSEVSVMLLQTRLGIAELQNQNNLNWTDEPDAWPKIFPFLVRRKFRGRLELQNFVDICQLELNHSHAGFFETKTYTDWPDFKAV